MRIRSLFTAALSVALVLGGALPSIAAVEPVAPRLEADPAPKESPAATLVIAPLQPVFADAKAPLELSALVRNPTDRALAAGELVVELSEKPVADAAELAAPEGLAFSTLTTAQIGDTAPASDDAPSEQQTTIEVAPAELPFTETTPPGTYVVRASLTAEGDDAPYLTTTTPVVWRGAGTRNVALSVIVPFVLPATIYTMPTRAQLSDLTPGWDRLLTAAEAARATLAIDPRMVAGIRSYGIEAPEAAREFLTRLEASTSPSFLLQFADADVAAQAALGFTSLMGPTNLEFVTRFGEFEAPEPADGAGIDGGADVGADATNGAANGAENGTAGAGSADAGSDPATGSDAENATPGAETPGTDAAGTDASLTNEPAPAADPESAVDSDAAEPQAPADSDEPVAPPTLAELVDWPGAPAVWPAEGNVDQGTLDLLTQSNIDSVVLDSSNVKHRGGPRIALGDGEATVTDAGLSSAATEALTGSSEVDRAAGLAQLAATLAVRAQTEGDGMVLGLDRAAVADATDPEALLTALAELDFVRATRVADQAEGTGTLRAAGPLEPRLALLRSAANREASVNEVGAVLIHPQYLSGYQRTRLLELFSTRYAPAESNFDAAATKYRTRDSELLEGVQAVTTEHTQLVSVSTSVPVQLHNSLPFDANVTVVAVPVSAALEVPQRVFTDVVVEAEANERVLVPVRSRVTSGESGLVVTISAPGGEPTVYTGTLGLSISTTVETVALWVLGLSAGLLVAFGVYRSVRKRRKPSSAAPDEAAGDVPDTETP